MTRERTETTTEGTAPTREVVLIARRRVLAARAAYRAGTLTLDDLYAVVDRYIDVTQQRAKALGMKTRRVSRGYLLRAL